jgi:hypothetical protein
MNWFGFLYNVNKAEEALLSVTTMVCKDHSSYCGNNDCAKYFFRTAPLSLTHAVNGPFCWLSFGRQQNKLQFSEHEFGGF